MQVSISELRKITDRLLTVLEKKESDSIEITVDYYWDIPKGNRHDPYEQPTGEFTIGQISDDWKELVKILESKDEPIMYSFVWLSSIIKAIGEELVV